MGYDINKIRGRESSDTGDVTKTRKNLGYFIVEIENSFLVSAL